MKLQYLVLIIVSLLSVFANASASTWSTVGFPMIYYTPETKFGLSGSLVVNKPTDVDSEIVRSNSIPISVFVTSRGQWGFIATPNLFFNNNENEIRSSIGYSYYPNSFYGLGMNSKEEDKQILTGKNLTSQFSLLQRFQNGFVIGGGVQFRKDIHKFEREISDSIIGKKGGNTFGFGPILEWDTRNHGVAPTKGILVRYQPTYFAKILTSDYEGLQHNVDIRAFTSFIENQVLAYQFFVSNSAATLPFDVYSNLGLRGVSDERLRDRGIFMNQAEYRFKIYNDFGGVAFLAAGKTFNSDFDFNKIVASEGFGLRYALDAKERINFRLDIGFSKYGVAPYLQIMESF